MTSTVLSEPLAEKAFPAVLAELVKARLSGLVVLTTAAGFYLGSPGPVDWGRAAHTLVGTGLLAAGAAALNQYLERDTDALMERTRERPLPAGRVSPAAALVFGGVCALLGLAWLVWWTPLVAAALGALTLALYLGLYTPLKRVSTLNTIVGAVPGALPPLIGWALFALQFFWQVPHFLAIAWLYREDYARAGLKMLPVVDPAGERTGLQSIGHTLGLLTASLSPVALGLAGPAYLLGALALGGAMLGLAVRFARRLDRGAARGLFLASIVYLPAVLGLMVLDRVR
jgi:protoheme IX farnesyltransferase